MEWEAVIGLEVHVQLKTKTKIFCGCSTEYEGDQANKNVCPVCLGHPGVLPKLNEKVLDYAIRGGLALNCKINNLTKFDRKNYFYPDLPKAYQISQFDKPYCEFGYIDVVLKDGTEKRINITRIHMEEDAGKLVHSDMVDESYVNLNRACIPLIEIVSEPDMRSSEEAYEYLTKLKTLIKYSGISDCSMELGSLRCDANVSVRKKGAEKLGTRTETKNMNSFKSVARAIEYEIERQIEVIEGGGKIIQETRLWDDNKGETRSMRSKEEAHDYRYFPDPDLVDIDISDEMIAQVKSELPEFPEAKVVRFMAEYGIPEYDAKVLSTEKALADYFEKAAKESQNFKAASNWVMGDVMRTLKDKGIEIEEFTVEPSKIAKIIKLIDSNTISSKMAKEVFEAVLGENKEPEDIIKERGLVQITDTKEIEDIIDRVIANNAAIVADFKSGKEKAFMSLVGQTMKETKGKANPKMVNELLRDKLTKI